MSLRDLKRILPPKPVQRKVCLACRAFAAECEVPVGEGSAPMCWNCAHHVVDHNVPIHEAMTAECECTPDQIYPDRDLDLVAAIRFPHGDVTWEQLQNATHEIAHVYNHKTRTIERIEIPLKRRN